VQLRRHFLGEALDSVAGLRTPHEDIVVDGDSTDINERGAVVAGTSWAVTAGADTSFSGGSAHLGSGAPESDAHARA
jgi:hypothetical protein